MNGNTGEYREMSMSLELGKGRPSNTLLSPEAHVAKDAAWKDNSSPVIFLQGAGWVS